MTVDKAWIAQRTRDYFAGAHTHRGETAWQEAIEGLLDLVLKDDRHHAYFGLRETTSLAQADKTLFIEAVNEAHLLERELEWTNHGILRSFRFWSLEEKRAYLGVMESARTRLHELSPYVALGFGAVLAYKRDGDFIPHDDDLDLLIAFDQAEVPRISEGVRLVEQLFSGDGERTGGDLPTHRNVWLGEGRHIDVFVGLVEDDRVSWFPSRRKNLAVDQVFPTRTVRFLGESCAMPADIEGYLAATYGPDWSTPIPTWNHPWNRPEYEDII